MAHTKAHVSKTQDQKVRLFKVRISKTATRQVVRSARIDNPKKIARADLGLMKRKIRSEKDTAVGVVDGQRIVVHKGLVLNKPSTAKGLEIEKIVANAKKNKSWIPDEVVRPHIYKKNA